MLEISIYELDETLDNLNWLKALSFVSFSDALLWATKHGLVHLSDEDEGYIDFTYERFSCSFSKKEDGTWGLTDLVEVYDHSLENIIMSVVL